VSFFAEDHLDAGLPTRTFTYDSLSRLTKAVNPESGTVIYTYDNVGNLYQRTDNRQITTTNTYDALNRIKTTTYSDNTTPSVTYTYDSGTNANGQLTSVAANGISTTRYSSFDVMGRFHASTQQTGNQTFGARENLPTCARQKLPTLGTGFRTRSNYGSSSAP
jgi:YD repeat-containing protein